MLSNMTRKALNFSTWNHIVISLFVVVFVPIILYAIGFKNFINSVDFVGKIFLPLEAIFIIFIWLNANKKLKMPPLLLNRRFCDLSIPFVILIFLTILFYGILI